MNLKRDRILIYGEVINKFFWKDPKPFQPYTCKEFYQDLNYGKVGGKLKSPLLTNQIRIWTQERVGLGVSSTSFSKALLDLSVTKPLN